MLTSICLSDTPYSEAFYLMVPVQAASQTPDTVPNRIVLVESCVCVCVWCVYVYVVCVWCMCVSCAYALICVCVVCVVCAWCECVCVCTCSREYEPMYLTKEPSRRPHAWVAGTLFTEASSEPLEGYFILCVYILTYFWSISICFCSTWDQTHSLGDGRQGKCFANE